MHVSRHSFEAHEGTDAARYLERLEARGERAWVIGEVLAGEPHIEIV